MRKHYLNTVFEPRSVAVIGADEAPGSLGACVMRSLIDGGFPGELFPVNPELDAVMGIPALPAISELDTAVDLAIIALPPARVAAVLNECAGLGVAGIAILSDGARVSEAAETALQSQVLDLARSANIPVIGPGCQGLFRPAARFHAGYIASKVLPGEMALVTQSGAFCSALLDWCESRGLGFSAVASLGATADIGFGEILDYLAIDPTTRSILLYMDRVTDARAFMSGLRVAARMKPVVVVKSGRSAVPAPTLPGEVGISSDEVFDAALRRAGAVRVTGVNPLFAAALTLGAGVRVLGPRLAVLTNGGGPGIMALDRAADLQVPVASLSAETCRQLQELLPPGWSPGSPLDILGDADGQRYRDVTRLLLEDDGVDGLLVLLSPLACTDATACAEGVMAGIGNAHKPVLACWMGGERAHEGRARLRAGGIPLFASPEGGVEAFGYLAAYRANQSALLQAPAPLSRTGGADLEGARLIIANALNERRRTLNTTEAKAILKTFQIPVTTAINAGSPAEALVAAESLGLPVVMKINSPDIPVKSEAGGVELDVSEAHGVARAYQNILERVRARHPDARIDGVSIERLVERPQSREIMIGITRDAVFGPVISFGAGGAGVDVFADRAVALPPLNTYLGRELVERTRIARMLEGFRQLPAADMDALLSVLQRVSEMACELPQIEALDINPLLLDDTGITALDVRIRVSPADQTTGRYGHMAIHPYPRELETTWHLNDGTDIAVRPIRPEDAEIEQDFVQNLSAESRYFRFMNQTQSLSPDMLARFTQIDYDREMALVAVLNEGTAEARIIGVARYVGNPDEYSCEFALTVADDWQHKGLGRQLMQRLMTLARDRGLSVMEGDVLSGNHKMLRLCTGLGFHKRRDPDDPEITVVRRHL